MDYLDIPLQKQQILRVFIANARSAYVQKETELFSMIVVSLSMNLSTAGFLFSMNVSRKRLLFSSRVDLVFSSLHLLSCDALLAAFAKPFNFDVYLSVVYFLATIFLATILATILTTILTTIFLATILATILAKLC